MKRLLFYCYISRASFFVLFFYLVQAGKIVCDDFDAALAGGQVDSEGYGDQLLVPVFEYGVLILHDGPLRL